MIEVKQYTELADFFTKQIVPQSELQAWRDRIKKIEAEHCPQEVRDFIEALAAKLGDFGEIRKVNHLVSGFDLKLAGMKEIDGVEIYPWEIYPMPIPFMVAVDHRVAMHRIFKRRGKEGLIGFCKTKVRESELESVLEVLTVHVFKLESEEFKKVMKDIQATKKLASI